MKYLDCNAYFSRDRRHRYWLSRQMSMDPGCVAFVGLNPSTADERTDDPTVRRCIGYAMTWGYGRMLMLNLHAYRSTDPRGLEYVDDPVGEENATQLLALARAADLVVCAWGANALHVDAIDIAHTMAATVEDLKCFGLTKDGHPKHPLYLAATTPLAPWPGLPMSMKAFGHRLPRNTASP